MKSLPYGTLFHLVRLARFSASLMACLCSALRKHTAALPGH